MPESKKRLGGSIINLDTEMVKKAMIKKEVQKQNLSYM